MYNDQIEYKVVIWAFFRISFFMNRKGSFNICSKPVAPLVLLDYFQHLVSLLKHTVPLSKSKQGPTIKLHISTIKVHDINIKLLDLACPSNFIAPLSINL